MNLFLDKLQQTIEHKYSVQISQFEVEQESQDYAACQFYINNKKCICRNAKNTPKKAGQFVTFWKRTNNGPIQPFSETDKFDFFVIVSENELQKGVFLFPKTALIEKGIVASIKHEGKRAFRVYPPSEKALNKQAEKSQKWQVQFYVSIENLADIFLQKLL